MCLELLAFCGSSLFPSVPRLRVLLVVGPSPFAVTLATFSPASSSILHFLLGNPVPQIPVATVPSRPAEMVLVLRMLCLPSSHTHTPPSPHTPPSIQSCSFVPAHGTLCWAQQLSGLSPFPSCKILPFLHPPPPLHPGQCLVCMSKALHKYFMNE